MGEKKLKRFLSVVIVFLVAISIIGCSSATDESWEESATLVREVIVTDDGQTEDFVFRIGDNGKLGIGEYGPFIAGESQKHMWHFGENKKY